ncbi:MAG: fumarylacetoacetate hydrolase family protein [Gammaproteobacteria bacterium]
MNHVYLSGDAIAPSKIVCVGRNYVAHIEELGNEVPENMVLFCKPNSAIGSELVAVRDEPLHYEGELCFMVLDGKLAAVGFGLDLTKRGLQSKLKEKGLPWERAKAFDGAALFSEFVPVDSVDPTLNFELSLDGVSTQRGNLDLMIYKPDQVLAEVSAFMSLNDGDIIMTGTPKGVGEVRSGTRFEGRVMAGDSELVSVAFTAS